MIVTFYSYKGGVGRTQLVANIAAYLCFHMRKKVLLIDWDLEAPGLHFYFDKPELKSHGIIDLFNEYIDVASQMNGEVPIKDLPIFTKKKYCSNIAKSKDKEGVIDLIPAGLYDKSFNKRINSFDWFAFFNQLNGINYIESIKDKINSFDYDYVFIDSRTGVTDYSGITNVQMPEVNIIVTISNHQNFDGSLKIINGIENSPYIKNGFRKAIVFPILSKIDMQLEFKSSEWQNKFIKQFDDKVKILRDYLGNIDFSKLIENTRLEYVKDVSFEETILFSETNVPFGNLSKSYINIANNLQVIKNKIENPDFIKDLIIAYLSRRDSAKRQEIDDLVINKLSNSLTIKQKRDKIKNVLQDLSKDNLIMNKSKSTKYPIWVLNKKVSDQNFGKS